jgi:hypothetical protein
MVHGPMRGTDGLNEFTRRSTGFRTHLKYEHEIPFTIETRYKTSAVFECVNSVSKERSKSIGCLMSLS